MTFEMAAWVFIWAWGSYYYYQYKKLLKAGGVPATKTATGAKVTQFKITYLEGRATKSITVQAPTEKEALRVAFQQHKIRFTSLVKTEQL